MHLKAPRTGSGLSHHIKPVLFWSSFLRRSPEAVDAAQRDHVLVSLLCDWLRAAELLCDWLRADQLLSADLLEAQRGLGSVLTGSQRSTARSADGLLPADRPASRLGSPPLTAVFNVSSDAKAEQLRGQRDHRDHRHSAGQRPGPEAASRQGSSGARSGRPAGPGRGGQHGETVQEVRPGPAPGPGPGPGLSVCSYYKHHI